MCRYLIAPKEKYAWALYVFGDVLCAVVVPSNDLFFPITPLHTCGSFTFMVIQIMKLSIRGILWWEQWTQLPPAACEMGWQTLRQMGEAALGRQSNHIHLACFPFPLFMCSVATYQQAGAKEPGIITSHTPTLLQTHTHTHTHMCTNTLPEVHSIPHNPPPIRSSPLTCTSGFCLPSNNVDLKSSHTSPAGGGRAGEERVLWTRWYLPQSWSPHQLARGLTIWTSLMNYARYSSFPFFPQ